MNPTPCSPPAPGDRPAKVCPAAHVPAEGRVPLSRTAAIDHSAGVWLSRLSGVPVVLLGLVVVGRPGATLTTAQPPAVPGCFNPRPTRRPGAPWAAPWR